ncbi:MAG: hypothetical protein H6765_08965 [Candidatus Peribacteria bacterium]|nr:MAG: hypothetical protein H6765_08965 [Candidatus Peribacteria bacterium]
MACAISIDEFTLLAQQYVQDTGDEKTSVYSIEEAIQGAMDIIAEIVADDPALRQTIKTAQDHSVTLESSPGKDFAEHSVYDTYKNYSKPLAQMPSYAYLAIARAESEKQLRVKLLFNEAQSIAAAKKHFLPN